MNIILFSDLHGRILLAFKLVQRFQKERGIAVDLILQCGDMGIFPDLHKLDKATIRHAQNNPSELGFHHHFTQYNPSVEAVLAESAYEMVCVRGNHEDHDFLDQLEQQSSQNRFFVDYYQRISMCKTGALQNFSFGNSSLNCLGIGRIGSQKDSNDSTFIQEYEKAVLRKAIKDKTAIDILITHDGAKDFVTQGYGMQEIRDVLHAKKPALHFYGHTGKPFCNVLDDNGITRSIKIAELEFNQSQVLPYGCLLFLQWNTPDDYQLEVIDEPWINEYQANTWEYL